MAEFIETERNSVAGSFLRDHGLIPLERESLPSTHPVSEMKDLVSGGPNTFYVDLRTFEVPNTGVFKS